MTPLPACAAAGLDRICGQVAVIDKGFLFWDSVGSHYGKRNMSEA